MAAVSASSGMKQSVESGRARPHRSVNQSSNEEIVEHCCSCLLPQGSVQGSGAQGSRLTLLPLQENSAHTVGKTGNAHNVNVYCSKRHSRFTHFHPLKNVKCKI